MFSINALSIIKWLFFFKFSLTRWKIWIRSLKNIFKVIVVKAASVINEVELVFFLPTLVILQYIYYVIDNVTSKILTQNRYHLESVGHILWVTSLIKSLDKFEFILILIMQQKLFFCVDFYYIFKAILSKEYAWLGNLSH